MTDKNDGLHSQNIAALEEFCEKLEGLLQDGRDLLEQFRESDGSTWVDVTAVIPANGFEIEPDDTILRGRKRIPIGAPTD